MKPRFVTVLLCALLGLVLWLMPTQWLPWLGAVRGAGEGHFGTATTVITVLLLLGIGAASVAATACIKIGTRLIPQPDFRSVLQVMGVVFLVVLLTGASFVAPIAGAFSNAVYVSAGGNLTAAKNAALAGGTIFVGPGNYPNSTNLLKDLVNWWFAPGASLSYTNQTNDGGFGIFDDRFSASGIRCDIGGYVSITYCSGVPTTNILCQETSSPTNVMGALVLTNPASAVTFRGQRLDYYHTGANTPMLGALAVVNCATSYWEFAEGIYDALLGTSGIQIGIDYCDTLDPIYVQSRGIAVYWDDGEMTVKSPVITARTYGYYAVRAAGNPGGNAWLTGDLMIGKVYVLGGTNTQPTWKSWVDYRVLSTGTNNSNGNVVDCSGGAFLYIRSEKIEDRKVASAGSALVFNSNGINPCDVWIETQKLSSTGRFFENQGGNIWLLRVGHYDQLGASDVGILNTSGYSVIQGGLLTMTNGIGLRHHGGTTDVFGLRLETSGTNNPVMVKNSGLVMTSSRLINASVGFGITTDVATNNTVTLQGVHGSKLSSNLITVAVGPYTIDANAR